MVHFRLAELESEVEALRSLAYRTVGKYWDTISSPTPFPASLGMGMGMGIKWYQRPSMRLSLFTIVILF